MDFQPSPHAGFSDAFEAHIDLALEAANRKQPPRNYLGGSRLGVECERQLAYEFHQAEKDEERHFKGKTLRIFDMGHDGEERVAQYLRAAGFTMITEGKGGRQIGFGVAWSDERGCYQVAGHIDGVVTTGPAEIGGRKIQYPALWENKAVGNAKWSKIKRESILKADIVYYTQMQVYMAYLDLGDNPALFTALNRETGELYAELVPFAPDVAQAASDKGVRVIQTREPEELPRIAKERTFYKCKWCDYQDRCWGEQPEVATEITETPSFMRR